MTSIEFQVERRASYAYVRCRGTYSLEALLHVNEAALDAAAHESLKAALVDLRDVGGGPPTTLERYEFGVHMAKLQSDPGRRLLLAVVGHEPMVDPRRFGEIVARNRGAVGRVFTDIDEASAWIDKELANE